MIPEMKTNPLREAYTLAQQLIHAIDYMEGSSERTSAKARAEECLAYLTKLVEKHNDRDSN
jgi:hypothetical protein